MAAQTMEMSNVRINSLTNTTLNLKGAGSSVILNSLAIKCEITKLFLRYFYPSWKLSCMDLIKLI